MKPVYFKSPSDFRKWLEKNYDKSTELWVGYHKKHTGKPSLTWPQSVDEALCFGWIDGIRKTIDEESYTIRFTPRKAQSNWSLVNIRRVKELSKLGLMKPFGLAVYNKRKKEKTGIYSFEQSANALSKEFEALFRKNKKAWEFFASRVASYRKPCIRWVMSAKQEETRLKRLKILINDSFQGKYIAPMRWNKNFR